MIQTDFVYSKFQQWHYYRD